jgi:hypothetical protein
MWNGSYSYAPLEWKILYMLCPVVHYIAIVKLVYTRISSAEVVMAFCDFMYR